MLKGGISGPQVPEENVSIPSAIHSIDTDIKLNRALCGCMS